MRVIYQRIVYCLINDAAGGTYHNFYNTSDLNGKEILDIEFQYRAQVPVVLAGTTYEPLANLAGGNGSNALINMRRDKSLVYDHYFLPITSTVQLQTDLPIGEIKKYKKRYRFCGRFDWFNSNVFLCDTLAGPPAPPYYAAFNVTYIDSDI